MKDVINEMMINYEMVENQLLEKSLKFKSQC